MFNSKKMKILSLGLAAVVAVAATISYAEANSTIKASVSQPALRNEYKSANDIRLDGAVSLTNGDRKISVSLRDSDVRQTMRMIADKAGLNIIFHNSVEGAITLDLVNVTLNDAFKMIMQASDLSYVIENNTLIVMSKDASLESDISKQNMMTIPVKYADAGKVAEFLNANVFATNRPGLSNNKIVVTNPSTNELVLFGTKNDYAMAQRIVAKLDVKPKTSTYVVNYTTPREMANMLCKSLFPYATIQDDLESEKINRSEFETGGAASGGSSGSELKAENVYPVELGAGKVACTLKGSANTNVDATNKLRSLGDAGLVVMYFPQTGRINVTGGSETQNEMIAEFIKDNDVKQPQAYIEMQIVELNESGSKDFNNTWRMWSPFFSGSFGNGGFGTNPLHPTFVSGNGFNMVDASDPTKILYGVTKGPSGLTLSYNINYLIENGKGRVLANPKMVVTNGQQSLIDLTSDYIKSTEAQIMGTAGVAGGVQKTYNIESDNGISITMTPYISKDGYVTLNMKPNYATAKEPIMDVVSTDDKGGTASVIAATLLQRRNLDLSNIRIKDGETLVIGGLIQETESKQVQKMPLLGDIPYLGTFFRNTITKAEKTELVIMVTPRILKDTDDIGKIDSL